MTDFFLRQITSRWKDLYKNEQKNKMAIHVEKKDTRSQTLELLFY